MFYIDDNNIHVTRGDDMSFITNFYINNEVGTLDDNSCIAFTVKSKNTGEIKIKRVITSASLIPDEGYKVNIVHESTLIPADKYEYSLLYVKYDPAHVPESPAEKRIVMEAYTYAQGMFEVMHSVTDYTDVGR